MGRRQCESCKTWFEPQQSFHKRCNDCVRKNRSQGGSQSNQATGSSSLQKDFDGYTKLLKDKGYFKDEEQKYLREELIVKDADMVAKALADAGVTTNQLRKFFNMLRSLEHQLEVSKDFEKIKSGIAQLQPFAAAIVGREQKPDRRARLELLREFIDINASKARESEQAFRRGFLIHFESIIAYFTFYNSK
jgi:CRISPR type III-A-associated protein Csm2